MKVRILKKDDHQFVPQGFSSDSYNGKAWRGFKMPNGTGIRFAAQKDAEQFIDLIARALVNILPNKGEVVKERTI